MAYCTPAQVRAVLDESTLNPDDATLQTFITLADNLVVNVCVPEGYDANTLTQIEIWLSAHCYAIMRPRRNQSEADTIKNVFDSKVDLGLKVTRYGQMAMLWDTKGALARLNFENMGKGKPKLTATWLGKHPRRTPPSGWPPGWPW